MAALGQSAQPRKVKLKVKRKGRHSRSADQGGEEADDEVSPDEVAAEKGKHIWKGGKQKFME